MENANYQFNSALKLIKEIFGTEHPSTAEALLGLAESNHILGKIDDARIQINAAFKLRVKFFGKPQSLEKRTSLTVASTPYEPSEDNTAEAGLIEIASGTDDNTIASGTDGAVKDTELSVNADGFELDVAKTVKGVEQTNSDGLAFVIDESSEKVLSYVQTEDGEDDDIGLVLSIASGLQGSGDLDDSVVAGSTTISNSESELNSNANASDDVLLFKGKMVAVHPDIAEAMLAKAHNLLLLGDFLDTEFSLLKRALAMYRKLFGPYSTPYVKTLALLAQLAFDLGHWGKASELYFTALERIEKIFGADHPDRLIWSLRLAECKLAVCQYSESGALLSDALTCLRRVYGEEHHMYVHAELAIGKWHRVMGGFDAAKTSFEKSFFIAKKLFCPELEEIVDDSIEHDNTSSDQSVSQHPHTNETTNGSILTVARDSSKGVQEVSAATSSIQALRAAIAKAQKESDESDLATERKAKHAALANEMMEPAKEALAQLAMLGNANNDTDENFRGNTTKDRQVHLANAGIGKRDPSAHPLVAAALLGQGQVAHDCSQYARAASLVERALKMCVSCLGDNHPTAADCLHTLAQILLTQGRCVDRIHWSLYNSN